MIGLVDLRKEMGEKTKGTPLIIISGGRKTGHSTFREQSGGWIQAKHSMSPIPAVNHVAERAHKSQETPQTALPFATPPRDLLFGELCLGSDRTGVVENVRFCQYQEKIVWHSKPGAEGGARNDYQQKTREVQRRPVRLAGASA